MDIARGELVEHELDRLIEKRALRVTGEQCYIEELYAESTRIHREKALRDNRVRWYAWHMDQADRLRRTMTALIAEHEARALALLEGKG